MGWLSSFIPAPADAKKDARPTSADGYKAPDRHERTLCWEARDAFFACLDKHDIVNSIKESEKAGKECGVTLKQFESDCASSWVTYFKKRRVMEHQREATIKRLQAEGADMEVPAGMQGAAQRSTTK